MNTYDSPPKTSICKLEEFSQIDLTSYHFQVENARRFLDKKKIK